MTELSPDITDALTNYAFNCGKFAAKLEAFNRDAEAFLAEFKEFEKNQLKDGEQDEPTTFSN